MPFTPDEFLRLAFQLCESQFGGAPTHARTSYGRGYYAAFLTARERLRPYVNEQHLDSPGAHSYVGMCLRLANHEGLRGLAGQLSALEKKRRASDYQLADTAVPTQVALSKINAAIARSWMRDLRAIPENEFGAAIRPPY